MIYVFLLASLLCVKDILGTRVLVFLFPSQVLHKFCSLGVFSTTSFHNYLHMLVQMKRRSWNFSVSGIMDLICP